MPKSSKLSIARGVAPSNDPNNLQPKIVKGALSCFKRHGVKKTTVDDICKEVGISRPTYYRFFGDRTDLLLKIANEELRRIVDANLKLQDSVTNLDDLFLEAIVRIVRYCLKSDVVQFLLSPENEDLSVSLTETDNETWETLMSGWRPLLDLAAKENRLRDPDSYENTVRWLTAAQTMMIVRNRALKMSEKKQREWIANYIVPSVLQDKS